jgi:hypothetical protein
MKKLSNQTLKKIEHEKTELSKTLLSLVSDPNFKDDIGLQNVAHLVNKRLLYLKDYLQRYHKVHGPITTSN